MRLRRARRPALAALEVVFVTAIGLPIAGFMYFTFERALDQFWFALGNAVGIPFL
jgi:hypothetical protein